MYAGLYKIEHKHVFPSPMKQGPLSVQVRTRWLSGCWTDGQKCACLEAKTCENVTSHGKGTLRWEMILDCLSKSNPFSGALKSREQLAVSREIWQRGKSERFDAHEGPTCGCLVEVQGPQAGGLWKLKRGPS